MATATFRMEERSCWPSARRPAIAPATIDDWRGLFFNPVRTSPARDGADIRYPEDTALIRMCANLTGRSDMAWLDLLAAFAWVVLAIGISLIVATVTRKGTASPDQYE